MNIVITSQGKSIDSMVDPRFGRAKYFIVYDLESGDYTAIDNVQNLNAPQGAGIQAGQNVIGTGAEVLITGNCGPKAFRILNAGDVKVYKSDGGTVEENIEKYKSGKLEELKDANVEGHWV
jgi:predicted Fe-Mo cluster-binding NifX family protein